MQSKFILLFLRSAGVLLLIAALAKLVSSLGSARFLDSPDPLLSISFRQVFRIAGAAELAIALICLFSKSINLRAVFVAWLATSFLIYRFGLWWIHYQKPCNCLGNLTDVIHVSPTVADNGMKMVLTYLLIGSYGALFGFWKQTTKASIPMPTGGRHTGC